MSNTNTKLNLYGTKTQPQNPPFIGLKHQQKHKTNPLWDNNINTYMSYGGKNTNANTKLTHYGVETSTQTHPYGVETPTQTERHRQRQ